jgi:glycosyltransferase involved in cell wall biosynthesis
MAKVSICIPTFNRKDYLKEALASVFAQTYKDYEVVVVDDGSTDGTETMLKSTGYPLRYYWQQNRGDAASRNKLLELARGKFVTFLDSDDLLMPDAVERMINVMEAEKEDVIVYGPYHRINENGNVCGRCKRKLYSRYVTRYLFQDVFIHSCGSMFPKKVLQKTGGFDESLSACSDYDLWLRLSLKYRFIALPEPTFKRRRHSGNLSKGSFANRKIELEVLENFYYNGGGKEVIPKYRAMKRLGEESYRAGRLALKEGLYDEGRRLLAQSFRRYPSPRALFLRVVSNLKQKLR